MTHRDVAVETANERTDEVAGDVSTETTAEQDRRQYEAYIVRQDFERALRLAREMIGALTSPGRPIEARTLRDWRERLRALERGVSG